MINYEIIATPGICHNWAFSHMLLVQAFKPFTTLILRNHVKIAPKHYVIVQWRRLGNHIWTWLLLCMTSRHLETILSLAYQVWYFPIFVDLFMSISYCIWYHLIWEKSYIDYRTSDSYSSDLDVTVFHYIYQFLTMETTHEYTRYHTTTVYTTYVIEDRCTYILDVF